jgi:hypothetical protein
MLKELFIALTLGALLGFGLTGGYLAIKNNQQASPSSLGTTTTVVIDTPPADPADTSASSATNQQSVEDTSNHQLTIDSPDHQSISTSSKTTVKGSTTPNSIIIISTIKQTIHVSSEANGSFSQEIDLENGANIIQIDSISPTDEIATNQLLVTYSTAKF